jgi:uncharacterized SAM-binding protein YcdF (DUF218 family)
MLLLSPMTLVLLGLVLAALALLRHRRWLVLASAALLLAGIAAMTPLVANALVRAVESRPQVRECAGLQAVVFLSGGVQHAPDSEADLGALTTDSVARIFGLARRDLGDTLPLVVSGGGPFTVAESDVVATLMASLGIAPDRVLLEADSHTTWESALAVRRLLPPDVTHVALATSALHLPRSALVYRAAGFDVCPWPLGTRWQAAGGAGALWPQSSGLLKSEAALHEIVGTLWYRLRLVFDSAGRGRSAEGGGAAG